MPGCVVARAARDSTHTRRPRRCPVTPDEIKPRTRSFIARHFKDYQLGDDEEFFALGFVNSLFAMQLIMFVEKEFQIKVDDEDLDIANFRSVNAVAELVNRKGRNGA